MLDSRTKYCFLFQFFYFVNCIALVIGSCIVLMSVSNPKSDMTYIYVYFKLKYNIWSHLTLTLVYTAWIGESSWRMLMLSLFLFNWNGEKDLGHKSATSCVGSTFTLSIEWGNVKKYNRFHSRIIYWIQLKIPF